MIYMEGVSRDMNFESIMYSVLNLLYKTLRPGSH